ncbi:DUF2793 domain-containing protein [Sulfitobacter sabulilitoris]|nr:DUF2793 domain-containing protein [Sulfitobacter sabulilitoris]
MSDISPKLALPFIQPAQAQKHVTHNEAIRRLDVLVQAVVEDRSLTLPPAAPDEGACFIVADGSTGAWAGRDGEIAVFHGDSWQFISPRTGWSAYVVSQGTRVTYTDEGWQDGASAQLLAARLGISADPDATNRLSVSSPATLFNHAGAGHQLKLNKAGPADTASLLFQSGFSGRAEMGLAGEDGWSLKVSADGTTWNQALRVDPVAGDMSLSPAGSERIRLTDTSAEINLPVTGSAVQSHEEDATSGRLMKVGAFGVGAPLVLAGGTPLHQRALKPGMYTYLGTALPDGPESAAWLHTLLVMQSQADGRRSFISLRTTGINALRAWFGAQSSDTSPIYWTRLLTNELILGAVSQSGGTPTGSIIERGGNASGSYVRFADGTQTCSGIDLLNTTVPANASGSLTWAFPAAFVAGTAVVTATGSSSGAAADITYAAQHFGVSAQSGIGTNSIIGYANKGTSDKVFRINAVATGRWF